MADPSNPKNSAFRLLAFAETGLMIVAVIGLVGAIGSGNPLWLIASAIAFGVIFHTLLRD